MFIMLSDAPFTSPWSSEMLITGDFKLPVVHDSDDEDVLELYKSTYNLDNHCHLDNFSGSSGIAGESECSNDDLYIEGEEDLFLFDISLNTCIQGLENNFNCFPDSSVMGDTQICSDDDMSSNSSYSSTHTCSPLTVPSASQAFTCSTIPLSRKNQSCRLRKTACRKWSRMSESEKSKAIDELSLTISNELSLREQLDIIKIINPSASLSKKTTEFMIDLNAIDDTKLEKIQEIVNFHSVQTHDVSDINHNNRSPNKKFSKRNKSQDRRPKVDKQRVQKEYRQKLKEKRSGLFVKEERLAVCSTVIEEDIDILG